MLKSFLQSLARFFSALLLRIANFPTAPPYPRFRSLRARRGRHHRRPRRLVFEGVQPREMLASDVPLTGAEYQNPNEPLDVDDDGLIAALDSLHVSNALQAHGSASFLNGFTPLRYLDVDGDEMVSILDFAAVVDFLIQTAATGPSGPTEPQSWATAGPWRSPSHWA